MDSPVLKFIVVGLGVFASFLAPFVESQGDVIPGQESIPSPLPPPPPPSSPPSPSPTQPPSPSPSQPPLPSPAQEPALPPAKENLNLGKKIGLLFAGIAVILQVCVVAFLVITRRQLLKNHGSRI